VLIKDFYFYLTLEGRNTLALLGNDFISCCDFRHLINGDIIIDNFDNVLLCDKFKSQCKKAFELDELVTATLEENETKNIAAAFNALYKEK
jgi:hypothetical protein